MFKLVKAYFELLPMLGEPKWSAVKDEFMEFVEEPSIEEAIDTLHGILALIWRPLGLLAWSCSSKLAQRYLDYGCPRSRRNHTAAGKHCCCKSSK